MSCFGEILYYCLNVEAKKCLQKIDVDVFCKCNYFWRFLLLFLLNSIEFLVVSFSQLCVFFFFRFSVAIWSNQEEFEWNLWDWNFKWRFKKKSYIEWNIVWNCEYGLNIRFLLFSIWKIDLGIWIFELVLNWI